MIKSLTIIFFFQFTGEALIAASGLPVPGNVIGMVLLTLSLSLGWIKIQDVKPGADVLVKNLALPVCPPRCGIDALFRLDRPKLAGHRPFLFYQCLPGPGGRGDAKPEIGETR